MNFKTDPRKLCFCCMTRLDTPNGICPRCKHDNRQRKAEDGLISNYIIGGRYYLGRKLGRGGFGVTYLGYDLQLERIVAIKEYFPQGVAFRMQTSISIKSTQGNAGARFEHGLKKAIEEGRKAAILGDVPGAVKMYDCVETNGTVYLIMEYVNGMTIRQYVRRRGRVTPGTAYRILKPLMETLIGIHGHHMIHRDISPDNVMIDPQTDRAILLDFGAARNIEKDGIGTGTVTVRHGYAPVEQYTKNGALDGRTDEYALCATMYYLMTGNDPEPSLNRMTKRLKKPSELEVRIGKNFENVLMKGMAINVQDRYENIAALRDAFGKAIERDEKGGGKVHGIPSIAGMDRKKGGVIAIAAAVAVLFLILVILLLSGQKKSDQKERSGTNESYGYPTAVAAESTEL